jgi:hypothetical protein
VIWAEAARCPQNTEAIRIDLRNKKCSSAGTRIRCKIDSAITTVATERQIAANRRNAQKSTGPRSDAGKTRASRNAYRHGLSRGVGSNAAFAEKADQLARRIAGDCKDGATLQQARAAAEGELELARAQRVKTALIQRMSAFGTLLSGAPTRSTPELIRSLRASLRREAALPEAIDPASTIPLLDPERLAEAVCRLLPELVRLDRYEHRAFARRDRAIREMIKNSKTAKR